MESNELVVSDISESRFYIFFKRRIVEKLIVRNFSERSPKKSMAVTRVEI